jgi:hypothetical protein
MVCINAHEQRLTYLRRLKCKKLLSGQENVAERLVYSRFFDTQIGERIASGVDGLLAALLTSASRSICTPQVHEAHA